MGNLIGIAADFLGLSKIKLAILAGGILIMVLLAGGIWFLWNKNQDLNRELGEANLTIQTMAEVIEQKKKDAEDIRTANQKLAETRRKNEEKIENLEIKLNALKLGYAGVHAPSETEAQVNKLIADQLRCIEITTGATTAPGEVNEMCPELMPQVEQ